MTELILTKVVRPRRRPDTLTRPRLLDTLLENAHLRLIFVSAPAGYGKTSLLLDFAHHLEGPTSWYTVAERDQNLWGFARYVVASIQRQHPEFGERTLRQVEREDADADVVVTTLVNELHGVKQRLWLFVDDFHLVDHSEDVKEFLRALIPILPDHCHLVMASRTVPDLDPEMVARFTARREFIGLGQEDLRFTPEEVRAFLRLAYNHEVSLDNARELAEASEGWVTALVLTTQAGEPLSGLARAHSAGGRLYDYLAGEVLDGLSPSTRQFLLHSSVLSEMEPGVVNAVLDIDDAQQMLEMLEAQNVFLTRLEEGSTAEDSGQTARVWYRYHSLFQEFLQARLRGEAPERYNRLQRQAARVWAEAGNAGQAVDHFLEAGAYEEAADAIEEKAQEMRTTARADRLSRWIDALPTEVLERRQRLLRHRASVSIERDGDPQRALELCEKAETLLDAEREPIQLAWTLLEKASALRMLGRHSEVLTYARWAFEVAGEDEPAVMAEAQWNIGLTQSQQGKMDKGMTALRKALDYWQGSDNPANCAQVHNDLGVVLRQKGNLNASRLHFQRALEIWESLGDANRAVMTLNNLALGYHDQGQFTDALKRYRRALRRAREAASRRYGAYVLIGMGDVYRDLRRYTDAIDTYEEGLVEARNVRDAFLGAYTLDALGQTYHLMGETQKGVGLVRRAYEDARERGASYERALYQLSLGSIAHERGFLDDAVYRLTECIEYFRESHLRELAKASMHLAQAHYLANHQQEMQECIREVELCLFRLGYRGFLLPTLLRTAGAVHATADRSPYLWKLFERAETRLGPAPEEAHRSPEPPLRVRMLGVPRVYLGDVPLKNEEWDRQRVQQLFFYLLTGPRRTTGEIGATLWPDLSPDKVKNNVYVTVSRLRQALGNREYVASEDGCYSLRVPHLWVDANQFREVLDLARSNPNGQAEIRQLERAVTLYRGDFLEEFPPPAEDFWLCQERRELRRLYSQALERLIDLWSARGDESQVRKYEERLARVNRM